MEKVEAFYKKSGGNRYYGIDFTLLNLNETDKLSFCIQINYQICYGFWINRGDGDYGTNDHLANIIKKIDENFVSQEDWLGWKYPNRSFDFSNFSDDEAFAFADEAKRSKHIEELSNEINEIIVRFNAAYKKERS